jgi:hypothetical protein
MHGNIHGHIAHVLGLAHLLTMIKPLNGGVSNCHGEIIVLLPC